MINTPVFQEIQIDESNSAEKELLVKLAYLKERFDMANDTLADVDDTSKMLNFHLDKAQEELSKIEDLISPNAPSPQDEMSKLRETYNGDIQKRRESAQTELASLTTELDNVKRELENKVPLKTESFELLYHNTKFKEICDRWKTREEFREFVEERVTAFNKAIGHHSIYLQGNADESNVCFLFPKSDLEAVESFIPKLMNDIRRDYEQNYIAKNYSSASVSGFESSDSTEHPFSLYGMSGKNHFYFYSRHDLANNTREQWLEAGKGVYGTPMNNKTLMSYQSLQPHFALPEGDEIGESIKVWKKASFGASVNGRHINRDRDGFDRIARITQQRVIENNPELAAEFEADFESVLQDTKEITEADEAEPLTFTP